MKKGIQIREQTCCLVLATSNSSLQGDLHILGWGRDKVTNTPGRHSGDFNRASRSVQLYIIPRRKKTSRNSFNRSRQPQLGIQSEWMKTCMLATCTRLNPSQGKGESKGDNVKSKGTISWRMLLFAVALAVICHLFKRQCLLKLLLSYKQALTSSLWYGFFLPYHALILVHHCPEGLT